MTLTLTSLLKRRYVAAALLALSAPLMAQQPDMQLAGLRHGTLPNGFTYYIYDNDDFQGEVNYFLYQNVGAIVESDRQNGLAHFMEHMAFEETEHFPQGVMKFLRAKGQVFNALTGTNETQFFLYNIPADNQPLRDSLLLVVSDWCNGIRITKAGVDKQRAIILQEARQRNTLQSRIAGGIAGVTYNGSAYSTHNVIGKNEVLRNVQAKDLAAFYRAWYRPDLQCLMIVGDVDLDACEQQVIRRFSHLKQPKHAEPRTTVTIADNDSPLYHHFTDNDNTISSVGIYQRTPIAPQQPGKDSPKEELLVRIFNQLMAQRLGMIRNEGADEFVAATISYAPLVRGYAQCACDIVPYGGRERQAVGQLLSLREAIRRYGFGENEFDDVKWRIYKELKEILSAERLGTPDNWMETFKQHYLYQTPLTTMRQRLSAQAEQLVELEADDLNNWVRTWMDDRNLSFVTYATPNDRGPALSQEDFRELMAEARQHPLMPTSIAPTPQNLIDFDIKPGKVLTETTDKELQAKVWKLSNGARVIYKQLPEARGRLYFTAMGAGGQEAVSPADVPSFSAMQSLIMQSGVYKYNRNQLYQWMSGKSLDLSLNIDNNFDGISGQADAADAEALMQYMYLVLTRQNFHQNVFDKFVERKTYLYKSRNLTGMEAVEDSIHQLLFPASEQNPAEDEAFYRRMNRADLPRLFADHFGHMARFSFSMVGSMPADEARALVERYIASLPAGDASAPTRRRSLDFSSDKQEIKRHFQVDVPGDMGEIEIAYNHAVKLTEKEEMALEVLRGLLETRYFTELREKEGATYSVGVRAEYTERSQPRATLNIHFTTSRAKVDYMKQRAYAILDSIGRGLFSQDEFKKIVVPLAVEQTEGDNKAADDTVSPEMWLAIMQAYSDRKLATAASSAIHDPQASIENLTPADITAVARKVLTGAKHREFVVTSLPENERSWEKQ